LQAQLDYRYYLTPGETGPVTLAFRGLLGSLVGPSLEDAPVDFLFYSGGGGTVRGHDFESLGVDVGQGDDVGGRSFFGISTEARFRTSGALGFVGFFDAGYVGRESYLNGSGEWQSGAGLGLRYATGIGPIRFDVAVPTSGDDNASSFYIYIGIGQAF
jgi:translocation and assembly module TamA